MLSANDQIIQNLDRGIYVEFRILSKESTFHKLLQKAT